MLTECIITLKIMFITGDDQKITNVEWLYQADNRHIRFSVLIYGMIW